MMIITFSSAIISLGDIMLDLGTPVDSLPLFNCCQNIKLNHKETFSYIFNDNLNYLRHLFNIGKMRAVTYDNIQKTILCGSIFLGWDFYECPHCHQETIIPHSCHSRFCTKCGVKETKQRSAYVSSMALDAHHRHVVFTIPWELRDYLIKHRELLDYLFIVARNTLTCLFNDHKFRKNKKKINNLFPDKINELKFHYHMIKLYSKDPIKCKCGELMVYSYSYKHEEGGKTNDRR